MITFEVPQDLDIQALPEYKDGDNIAADSWAKLTWRAPHSKPSLVRITFLQHRSPDIYVKYRIVQQDTGIAGVELSVTIGRRFNSWAVLVVHPIEKY